MGCQRVCSRLSAGSGRVNATFTRHPMIRINENYTKLKASYLFADIARRVDAYVSAHPDKAVIRLGIGDLTEPLPAACVEALHGAADVAVSAHPDKAVIRLGIGDLTEPLPAACVEALHGAADEMSRRATFKGYGPEQGGPFLQMG